MTATEAPDTSVPEPRPGDYARFVERATAYASDVLAVGLLTVGAAIVCGRAWFWYMDRFVWSPDEFTGGGGGGARTVALGYLLMVGIPLLVWPFVACLYRAGCESSRDQATPGKRARGLRVIGRHGERLTFWGATLRFLARFASFAPAWLVLLVYLARSHWDYVPFPTLGLALGLGVSALANEVLFYLSPRRQVVHDLLCGTRVIRVAEP